MTLYVFDTNIMTPRFNLYFDVRPGYPPTWPGPEHLEDIAESVEVTNAPECVKVRLIKRPVSREYIASAQNLMASYGRKPVVPKRIPDIWTSGTVQTASQAFKDLVDEVDPGVHQFIPVSLFENGSDKELTHTKFYHFVCCRILDVPPGPVAELRRSFDHISCRKGE